MREETDCRVGLRPPRNDSERLCDWCGCLEIEPPATSYGCYLACCTDVDKPMHGLRRVVDASPWPPFNVQTPVWCKKGGAALGKTPG